MCNLIQNATICTRFYNFKLLKKRRIINPECAKFHSISQILGFILYYEKVNLSEEYENVYLSLGS